MAERLSADQTGRLLLFNQRKPAHLRMGHDRNGTLPDAEIVLKLALGRTVDFTDPSLASAGTAALRDAAAAHVRQFHFRPDATPYQVLGLAPDASEQSIRESFRLLMQLVHPDRQGARRNWPDACAAQANRAYAVLRGAESRAAFDREEKVRTARTAAAREAAVAAASEQARRWPTMVANARRRPPKPLLPEWLTRRVGGFAREHPAAMMFGALIGGAALAIAAAAWQGTSQWLTRELRADVPATQGVPAQAPLETARHAGHADPKAPASEPVDPPSAPVMPPAVVRADAPSPPGRIVRITEPSPPDPPTAAVAAAKNDEAAIAAVAPSMPAATDEASKAKPIAGEASAPPVQAPVDTAATAPAPARAARALSSEEIEAVFIAFADAFNQGRPEAFAGLFDRDARTNQVRGRDAIRREYEALYKDSVLRRMRLARVSWTPDGDAMRAIADADVRIGWRDGRESEQRLSMELELARREGRVVITRISQVPGLP